MGQAQNKFCGGDQSFDKDINDHLSEFKSIFENVQSVKLINERFPSFKKQAEKTFNQIKNVCSNFIVNEEENCQKKLKNIKESIGQKYGSLREFERKKGCSVEKYLNSQRDMKQFDRFKDQVKVEFETKKKFLLNTLDTQKNLYISQLNKSLPSSVKYDNYTVEQQENLLQRYMKGDSDRAKAILAQAEMQYSKFVNKLDVPRLKQNLLNLVVQKQCRDHSAKIQSHWKNLIQSVQ